MSRPRTLAEWAKLTPGESVARWRIASAVWAGRLLALVWLLATILTGGLNRTLTWSSTITLLIACALVYGAAEMVKRGSRAAAVFLLVLFTGDKVLTWLGGGAPWYQGAFWSLVVIFCFVQGIWGTFLLAKERRRQQEEGALGRPSAA